MKTFDPKWFAMKLQEDRLNMNLTQKELAKKCGFQGCLISHYETGNRLPGLANFYLLCVALNRNPTYFMNL